MSEDQVSGLALLNQELGLDDDLLSPAPLNLTDTPPGVDGLGQPVIDGTTDDYTVEVPGLEEYTELFSETIDPTDFESMAAVDLDIQNGDELITRAEEAVTRLAAARQDIEEIGGICREDLTAAMEIYPALEDYIKDILPAMTLSRTRTHYAAGLEALSTGEKVLGGAAIVGIVAIMFKIISVVIRVMKSRAALNVTEYTKALRTSEDMRRYDEGIKHQIQELLRHNRDEANVNKAIKDILRHKLPNRNFSSLNVYMAWDTVTDGMFTAAVEHRYIALFDVIAGGKVKNIDFTQLRNFYATVPELTKTYATDFSTILATFIRDFNEDKVLPIENYTIKQDKYAFPKLDGFTSTKGIAGQVQFAAALTERVSDPQIKKTSEYMKHTLDLTAALQTGKATGPIIEDIAKQINELKRLAAAISTSTKVDQKDNRMAILHKLKAAEADLAHLYTKTVAMTTSYIDLSNIIQRAMDDTLKVYRQGVNVKSPKKGNKRP